MKMTLFQNLHNEKINEKELRISFKQRCTIFCKSYEMNKYFIREKIRNFAIYYFYY